MIKTQIIVVTVSISVLALFAVTAFANPDSSVSILPSAIKIAPPPYTDNASINMHSYFVYVLGTILVLVLGGLAFMIRNMLKSQERYEERFFSLYQQQLEMNKQIARSVDMLTTAVDKGYNDLKTESKSQQFIIQSLEKSLEKK